MKSHPNLSKNEYLKKYKLIQKKKIFLEPFTELPLDTIKLLTKPRPTVIIKKLMDDFGGKTASANN